MTDLTELVREVITAIEFVRMPSKNYAARCPFCYRLENQGHSAECKLADILDAFEIGNVEPLNEKVAGWSFDFPTAGTLTLMRSAEGIDAVFQAAEPAPSQVPDLVIGDEVPDPEPEKVLTHPITKDEVHVSTRTGAITKVIHEARRLIVFLRSGDVPPFKDVAVGYALDTDTVKEVCKIAEVDYGDKNVHEVSIIPVKGEDAWVVKVDPDLM